VVEEILDEMETKKKASPTSGICQGEDRYANEDEFSLKGNARIFRRKKGRHRLAFLVRRGDTCQIRREREEVTFAKNRGNDVDVKARSRELEEVLIFGKEGRETTGARPKVPSSLEREKESRA